MNDELLILKVTAVEEEVDDDVEDSVLGLKPPTSHSEAEQCYQSVLIGLKYKKRQVQRKSYFYVKYKIL